jgi:hypothetical protein
MFLRDFFCKFGVINLIICSSSICIANDKNYEIISIQNKIDELSKRISSLPASDRSYSNNPRSFSSNNQNFTQNRRNASFTRIRDNLVEIVDELNVIYNVEGENNFNNANISQTQFSSQKSKTSTLNYPSNANSFSKSAETSYWDNAENNVKPTNDVKALYGFNYWSVGYSRVSIDYSEYQSNLVNFTGRSKINDYFSGFGNFYFGKADYFNDLNRYSNVLNWEYGFSGGLGFSFDIFSSDGFVKKIRPFIDAEVGYEYSFAKALATLEDNFISFGWGFTWGSTIGTEFILGESFSFAPRFRIQDIEPSSLYGLDIAYFFNDSFGLKLGYSTGSEYSRIDLSTLFQY